MTDAPAEIDAAELRAVTEGLYNGVALFAQVREQMGEPIDAATLLSAMLSVTAMLLDAAPEDWRAQAVAQFTLRCAARPAVLN